ncbi:MAG: hypothetical protein ACFCUS_14170 [Rubrimonas sp.]
MKHAAITTPNSGRPLTEIDLAAWIGQAAPGDILEYHRGFLALDTHSLGSLLDDRDRKELSRVASRAMWAAEQGLVHLVQRRNGDGDFSYLAVARPKPKRAAGTLSALILGDAA